VRQLREQVKGLSPEELADKLASPRPSSLKNTLHGEPANHEPGMESAEPNRALRVDEKRLLGRGAFGMVLAAEWKGKPVAVKRIHADAWSVSEFDTRRRCSCFAKRKRGKRSTAPTSCKCSFSLSSLASNYCCAGCCWC
jgi:hypothetical protein